MGDSKKLDLISLGLACQTRWSLDLISAKKEKLPFDFGIVKKQVLLKSLREDGSPFIFGPDDCRVHKLYSIGVEGVRANDFFFWHDYERPAPDYKTLAPDWRLSADRTSKKYLERWQRFLARCKNDQFRKIFVLSNSQLGLHEYLDDNESFDDAFRLTADFVLDIKAALADLGARDFGIHLVVRKIDEYVELSDVVAGSGGSISANFAGVLKFPPNSMMVHDLGVQLLGSKAPTEDVSEICGDYIGGMQIRRNTDRSALAYIGGREVGELRAIQSGYVVTLDNGADFVMTATFSDGRLRFSNDEIWTLAA